MSHSFHFIYQTQDEIVGLLSGWLKTNRGNEFCFRIVLHSEYSFIYSNDQTLIHLRQCIDANTTIENCFFDQYCSNLENHKHKYMNIGYKIQPTLIQANSIGAEINVELFLTLRTFFLILRRILIVAWISHSFSTCAFITEKKEILINLSFVCIPLSTFAYIFHCKFNKKKFLFLKIARCLPLGDSFEKMSNLNNRFVVWHREKKKLFGRFFLSFLLLDGVYKKQVVKIELVDRWRRMWMIHWMRS